MQTIYQKTLNDTMYYNKIPVFTYTIHYPFFMTTCNDAAAQRINCSYAGKAREQEIYCRTVLYPQAVESARYIKDNQPPFYSYELLSEYHITFNSGCITSLYTDQYTFMGGAHGSTVRDSQTWDFITGCQLDLRSFYPYCPVFPHNIFTDLEAQIKERLTETPGSYFDDYAILLRKNFNEKSYYLRPEDITIYYQQYDIAPYSTGIPEFQFRFS